MNLLDQIVPIILTYDEAPNISRCLQRLAWAREVLVVDSYSTDDTVAICASYANVRVLQRRFDSHSNQWNFALAHAPCTARWLLAMDADYMLTEQFVRELASLVPDSDVAGYRCSFRYAVFGRILRSGLYPPAIAIFRNGHAHFVQDGHTQRVVVKGKLASIAAPILHDDRKTLDRWIASQRAYSRLEAGKIAAAGSFRRRRLKEWLRARTPLSPLAVAAYCLFVRGGIFEGRAGWYYALQRMTAEALISTVVLDNQLRIQR